MGLFRRDDKNKRKFKMREDLLSFGDDYWIEDEGGAKAFHVNGKALRARDTVLAVTVAVDAMSRR